MNLPDFDYSLPPDLIAQEPAPERDQSRLMILDRKNGTIVHEKFSSLPNYIQAGDVLVLNDTKVWPARLVGKKESGGKIDVLLVRKRDGGTAEEIDSPMSRDESCIWDCFIQNSGKLQPNARLFFDEGIQGELFGKSEGGYWRLRLTGKPNLDESLARIGYPPLPPYIKRNPRQDRKKGDAERYQTIYARKSGAIAAPTAGLHFTESVLEEIRLRGGRIALLTLHVGVGTFLPVKTDPVENHRLESEVFDLPRETAETINQAKGEGKRVFAVGTTVVRTLESCVSASGRIYSKKGQTELFILPGHRFHAVDALITNFHLPRSTLLMLVAAFAGRERILTAYEEAIKERYRFYSYGDAMLIL